MYLSANVPGLLNVLPCTKGNEGSKNIIERYRTMKKSLFKRALATVATVPLALTQCLTGSLAASDSDSQDWSKSKNLTIDSLTFIDPDLDVDPDQNANWNSNLYDALGQLSKDSGTIDTTKIAEAIINASGQYGDVAKKVLENVQNARYEVVDDFETGSNTIILTAELSDVVASLKAELKAETGVEIATSAKFAGKIKVTIDGSNLETSTTVPVTFEFTTAGGKTLSAKEVINLAKEQMAAFATDIKNTVEGNLAEKQAALEAAKAKLADANAKLSEADANGADSSKERADVVAAQRELETAQAEFDAAEADTNSNVEKLTNRFNGYADKVSARLDSISTANFSASGTMADVLAKLDEKTKRDIPDSASAVMANAKVLEIYNAVLAEINNAAAPFAVDIEAGELGAFADEFENVNVEVVNGNGEFYAEFVDKEEAQVKAYYDANPDRVTEVGGVAGQVFDHSYKTITIKGDYSQLSDGNKATVDVVIHREIVFVDPETTTTTTTTVTDTTTSSTATETTTSATETTTSATDTTTSSTTDTTTTTTTTTTTSTTTTTEPPVTLQPGAIVWDIDEVNANAGDTVTVDMIVKDPYAVDLAVDTIDFSVSANANLTLESVANGDAYTGAALTTEGANVTVAANGAKAADGSTVLTFTYKIADTCPAGTYAITVTGADTNSENVVLINGAITVTEKVIPLPDGVIAWDIDDVTAKAGEDVKVNVYVRDPYAVNLPVAGAQFNVVNATEITYNSVDSTTPNAYGLTISYNVKGQPKFAFVESAGNNKIAENGGIVLTLTYTVPVGTPAGKYELNLSDLNVVDTNGTNITKYVFPISGSITVVAPEPKLESTYVKADDALKIATSYGFYLSHNDGSKTASWNQGFNAAQVGLDTITMIEKYDDGTLKEVEVSIDDINFNGETPSTVYDVNNTTFKYEVALYNGTEALTDEEGNAVYMTAYIGVKGDANLDNTADSSDAAVVLSYYAKVQESGRSADTKNATVLTKNSNGDETLDQFAAFLADVNANEANYSFTKGENTLDASDAAKVLEYFAAFQATDKAADDILATWKVTVPSVYAA